MHPSTLQKTSDAIRNKQQNNTGMLGKAAAASVEN